jgi:hypothetical protein
MPEVQVQVCRRIALHRGHCRINQHIGFISDPFALDSPGFLLLISSKAVSFINSTSDPPSIKAFDSGVSPNQAVTNSGMDRPSSSSASDVTTGANATLAGVKEGPSFLFGGILRIRYRGGS